jgi:hypothetical protein
LLYEQRVTTSFGNIVPNLRQREFFLKKNFKKFFRADFEAFTQRKKTPRPKKKFQDEAVK